MKFARNVRFSSSDIDIEEVQIIPDIIEEVIEEPEIETFEFTQEELDGKLRESEEKGFQKGIEETEKILKIKTDEVVEKLNALILNFNETENKFFKNMENYIIKIASKISENIIKAELKENPTLIIHMVNTALNKMKDSKKITIFTSAADFLLLEEVDFHKKLNLPSETDITFITKNDLSNGSFYIESDLGNNLYSLIRDQIEEIEEQL